MRRLFLLATLMIGVNSFVISQTGTNYIQYVKPFVGTKNMGHTYPGATVPFGMVQLSPETDTVQYELNGKYNGDVYKYCSGYQYDDKTIVGFSHTHFSGTGHSDLGDFLIMPPEGEFEELDVIEIENSSPRSWSIRFDLWSKSEGKSDLTLEATFIENNKDILQVELDNIHIL